MSSYNEDIDLVKNLVYLTQPTAFLTLLEKFKAIYDIKKEDGILQGDRGQWVFY